MHLLLSYHDVYHQVSRLPLPRHALCKHSSPGDAPASQFWTHAQVICMSVTITLVTMTCHCRWLCTVLYCLMETCILLVTYARKRGSSRIWHLQGKSKAGPQTGWSVCPSRRRTGCQTSPMLHCLLIISRCPRTHAKCIQSSQFPALCTLICDRCLQKKGLCCIAHGQANSVDSTSFEGMLIAAP